MKYSITFDGRQIAEVKKIKVSKQRVRIVACDSIGRQIDILDWFPIENSGGPRLWENNSNAIKLPASQILAYTTQFAMDQKDLMDGLKSTWKKCIDNFNNRFKTDNGT